MGIIYSYFFGYGRTDDPDATTGLTSRDKYLIRTTWKEARTDPIQLGVDLLVEYVIPSTSHNFAIFCIIFFAGF